MKVNLTSILGLVIIVLLGIIFFQSDPKPKKEREVVVPVTLPAQRGYIHKPKAAIPTKEYVYIPLKETVDTTLLNKFRKENDSLRKELLYKDAITERWYQETFEDSLVKIDVSVRARGYLLGLSIPSYTIKPKKTSFTYLPPRELDLYAGVEVGVPTIPSTSFNLKASLMLEKDNRIYTLGVDTDRRVWGGLYFKLL